MITDSRKDGSTCTQSFRWKIYMEIDENAELLHATDTETTKKNSGIRGKKTDEGKS